MSGINGISDSALDKRLAPPVATHAGHLTSPSSSVQTQEIQGVTPRRDGNAVQHDREPSPTSSPGC